MANKCPKCNTDNPSDSKYCKECSAPLLPSKEIPVTQTIETVADELITGSIFAGRYQVIEELGKGGMGIVYKAEDTKLKRIVALKFLPLELTGDAEAKERFIREAQAAAMLDHPYICTIYEVDEAHGKTFISMAYVDGQNLREKIKGGPLEVKDALDIGIQATEGLAAAHRHGIVHRDIKSANIMTTKNGQAKIMDFGLAKFAGASMITRKGVTMGTVAYMSPEQAQGKAVDHRTDIWSLGVVLYEMFSGQLPFKGETEASFLYSIVHEEPKAINEINPNIPIEIQKVISRALRKKPDSRYQSAAEMTADLTKYQDQLKAEEAGLFNLRTLLRRLRQPRIAIPAAIALALIAAVATWFFNRQSKIRWAKEVAIPEIQWLIGQTDLTEVVRAFKIAQAAERYIPRDPTLLELLSECSVEISVQTEPPGANIYMKEYTSFNENWEFLGISPIENVTVPRAFMRWKIEKPGYETVKAASPTFAYTPKGWAPKNLFRALDPEGTIPQGMTRIAGENISSVELPDYFMDKFEVTNKQFKEFIDAGGYQTKKFWKYPFVKEDQSLTWEEAMAFFRDKTGRPGPSTWEAGDYPDGQNDYPVSGVSWYEAAAYAEFMNKSLPTETHWWLAFARDWSMSIFYLPSMYASLSNFGENPLQVGRSSSMNFFGCYDMAGNVKEWCWNESWNGRSLRGGAWGDSSYMMSAINQAPAFDRSARNGFRCVRYLEESRIPESVFEPVTAFSECRDFYKEKPVSDEVFLAYKERFSYERGELDATVEEVDRTSRHWIKERISFNAAYDNERVIAYLYFPKTGVSPFQTVIFFPGIAPWWLSKSSRDEVWEEEGMFDFIVRAGRAVMFPVYKGSYERADQDSQRYGLSRKNLNAVEYLIKYVKDFKRCVDYLETRQDIDSQKLAYLGYSRGGELANIIPAVEDRLKASISLLGGLYEWEILPALDPLNYVTRVKIPTLMLNGEYDIIYRYQTDVKPMYDLLGTPEKDKLLKLYKTDHHIPKNELIRETLDWLDKYLGPVKLK